MEQQTKIYAEKRKINLNNTNDSHQIQREENKRRRKLKRPTKTTENQKDKKYIMKNKNIIETTAVR